MVAYVIVSVTASLLLTATSQFDVLLEPSYGLSNSTAKQVWNIDCVTQNQDCKIVNALYGSTLGTLSDGDPIEYAIVQLVDPNLKGAHTNWTLDNSRHILIEDTQLAIDIVDATAEAKQLWLFPSGTVSQNNNFLLVEVKEED